MSAVAAIRKPAPPAPAARVPLNPLLRAHLSVVDPGTRLIGIGQGPGIRDLAIQIGIHYPAMPLKTVVIDRRQPAERHFQMVQDAVADLAGSNQRALVLLADTSITDLQYLHKISGPAKEASLRVVSCFARPVFRGPLANTSGLTYEAMFSRAALLARSQREPGDYLEFGVFDGRTMTLAWHAMKDIRAMRFFGFDTFKGIAGALAEEISYPDGSYYSNLETYWHNMQVANADPARMRPVAGNFLETFTDREALQASLGIERCLVAHIDCDVYTAAKASLNFLTNILVQGSVLLFDEFHANNASNQLGERRALREWLEENPGIQVERWMDYAAVGRAFFVHIDPA
jgi:O-methyltransferase